MAVFVVISLFILTAGVVLFGTTKFFAKTHKFVLYFNESVKGLDVGSPVLFEGVAVGSVIDIDVSRRPC